MDTQLLTPLDTDLQERLSFRSSVSQGIEPEVGPFPILNGNSHTSTFLKEWTSWRTNLNRSLILKSEITRQLYATPKGRKVPSTTRSFRKIVRGPNVEIDQELSDFVFQRALDDRYEGGRKNLFMKPETFLTFGIPRPKRFLPSPDQEPNAVLDPPSPVSSPSETEPKIIHGFTLGPSIRSLHPVNKERSDTTARINARQIEPFADYDNKLTRF